MVNSLDYYFYRFIGKLTAFLQFQEFNFRNPPVEYSTSVARCSRPPWKQKSAVPSPRLYLYVLHSLLMGHPSHQEHILLALISHNCRQFDRWDRTVNWRLPSTCRHHWRKQFFFMAGDHFFMKKNGVWLKKMTPFTKKMELFSIYCSTELSSSSTSSTPCMVFLRTPCIHPVMIHIWSHEKNRLQKRLFDKDSITTYIILGGQVTPSTLVTHTY